MNDPIRVALREAAYRLANYDCREEGPTERRVKAMHNYARVTIVEFLRALPLGLRQWEDITNLADAVERCRD